MPRTRARKRVKLPFANYIKRHHITRTALGAGVIAAAILFFVVGAGVRLLMGPISLGPLRGTIAGAIQQALPGINLDYDRAAIEWTRDQGRVNLVVLGARIRDAGGRTVINAPKAAIGLAAAPFLQGRFVVRRITLVGVEFTLVHMKSGRIRLGSEKFADNGEDIIARITDVIDSGDGGSSLESFAVREARITIHDEVTGLHVLAPRAELMIRDKGEMLGATFESDVEMSGRRSHVAADLTLPSGKGPVDGTVKVMGLDLRGLGANVAMLSGVRDIPMAVSATSTFRVMPEGALGRADFDIIAQGELPVAAMTSKALHVRRLRLIGRYDGAARRVILSNGNLDAREARANLRGQADFLLDSEGGLEKIRASLTADRIALDAPGLFKRPVSYQSVDIAADYLTGSRQFEVSKLVVAAQGFRFDATGTLTLNESGAPGIVARGRIPALPVRTLLTYWPLPVAAGARDWIDENIFAGDIGPLQADVNFAPGLLDQEILPEESMKLTFSMRNLEGSYVKGLTRATGVNGDAVMTGDTFRASFSSGRVGNLVATRGTALIPTLHKVGTVGEFGVHIEGTMPEVMTLIDMKPLNYPTKFGIDPKQTGGTAAADLMFKVPMLANLPVDDVGISVKAKVDDFAVALGAGTRVTNGNVTFDINNERLHQVGMVNLADSRLSVDWTEDFRTKDPITGRILVKGALTEGGRQALNIGLMRYFRGTAPISADIAARRGSLARADVTVDFTPATLFVPIVNLEKTPGQSATGRIQVNFAPGNIVQDQAIRIFGPVLNATGTATFDKAGGLSVLDFSTVRMGPLNDLAFRLTRTANGDEYVLRGRSLDGSRVGRNGSDEAPSAAAKQEEDNTPIGRFRISARLDRLAMRSGVAIMPFNLDLTGIENRPSVLSLTGNLAMTGAKTTPIAAALEPAPGGRKVTLTAGDAGLLARGLFGFESMRGGALTATVNLPGQATDIVNPNIPTPDFTGTLVVRDFQMVNQPLLARLFSAGSLSGFGDLMGSSGMSLDELNMPFSSKNNVISVDGARVRGSAIGASADGYIDRPKGQIALKGSLVPAYGLNSFISNVPVIGDILASRKGEGVFGVTYSLTGRAEQPNLSTNPLSMLTPGILRRIFEGHIPTAANAPSNAPQARPEPAPQ